MPHDDVTFLSAAALLNAYERRELSPVEVTKSTLERIDRLDPALNAYLTIDHEGALAAAKRAERTWSQPGEKPLLCGVPCSIKDLLYTSWLPTTHGSLLFREYYHPHNAPVADRLIDAGAVILGKTNTPEFGLLDITTNRLREDGRNPWNLDHTCGGSSGGAGAAVAAGLGPLAIGTDGAGSVRIPSFYNGIYGLKPTFGRIAHEGWRGAPHTSHEGPMTRTVRDAVLLMQAVSGPDARDPLCLREAPPNFLDALEPLVPHGTRVAVSLDYGYIEPDPEIRQAVLDAAELLRSLGCEIIESDPPRREPKVVALDMPGAEEYAYLVRMVPDAAERLDELTTYGRRVMEAGLTEAAWKLADAGYRRQEWASAVHRWFEGFDFFLAPVMGKTAPRCDDTNRFPPGKPWSGAFLPIFNASGCPAASIPFGVHSNGLPLAVQLAGRHGDDAGVLRMSAAIEAARPWADRWPPLALEGTAAPATSP